MTIDENHVLLKYADHKGWTLDKLNRELCQLANVKDLEDDTPIVKFDTASQSFKLQVNGTTFRVRGRRKIGRPDLHFV